MNKSTVRLLAILLAVVLIVIGISFITVGFDKMTNYENSEYSWGKHVNAYVGGDAYNYIINGTYFTGYSVLGGFMMLMGVVILVGCQIDSTLDKKLEEKMACVLQENPSETENVGNLDVAE